MIVQDRSDIVTEQDGSFTITIEPIPFAGMVTFIDKPVDLVVPKKFCTSCQTMRAADYGKMILGKRNRWKCTACIEKVAARKYASK